MTARRCESARRVETSHVTYCGRDEGHDGPCGFADGNGAHVWLDAYEIANLREVLGAISVLEMWPLMNGDWFEQIRGKLQKHYLPYNPPNKTADEIVAAVFSRKEPK